MGVNQAYSVTAFPCRQICARHADRGPADGRHAAARAEDPYPIDGTFTAINVNTGKIAWQHKSDLPMYGGVLATASNLVFTGEMNGRFRRF